MIETTYIRLEQAAAILDTDTDTLLIAAAEQRITAHWLFNSLIGAERGQYEEADDGPDIWSVNEIAIKHFMFIPLSSLDAANLLKRAEIKVELFQLSLPDSNGDFWRRDDFSNFQLAEESFRVTSNDVFFERAKVARIREIGIPDSGTVSAPTLRKPAPRDNSLIATVAAILAAWPGGTMPSGKDLEKAAQSIGLTISDDTIRKVLSMAKEAAPSLPLPK